MSNFVDGEEFYPGQDLSVSQLLHAAKRKSRDIVLGGRCVHAVTAMRKVTQT